MAYALTVVALLIGVVGIVFATQATLGVAFVGFAAVVAIAARILQAHVYHRELHPKERYRPVMNPEHPEHAR